MTYSGRPTRVHILTVASARQLPAVDAWTDEDGGMQLRRNDLTWHVAGDEVVVLDLAGSAYLKLNGSARVLWEALAMPRTASDLASELVETYGIDRDVAAADVATFLADLQQRGLLVD